MRVNDCFLVSVLKKCRTIPNGDPPSKQWRTFLGVMQTIVDDTDVLWFLDDSIFLITDREKQDSFVVEDDECLANSLFLSPSCWSRVYKGDCCLRYRSKAMPRSRCRQALICFVVLCTIEAHSSQTVLCPVLALPRHGYFLSNECERVASSLCGIGCLTGYRLTTGDSFRACQNDGLWSGEEPTCTGLIAVHHPLILICVCAEIRCPGLKANSRVVQQCTPEQNETSSRVGTRCRATCNATGYRLLGPQMRECLILSRWTGYDQYCIGKN